MSVGHGKRGAANVGTKTRPSDTTDELVAGLIFVLRERRRLDATVLPLATLMEELEAWVTSARIESWNPNSLNFASLRQELAATSGSVRPSLRAHLDEHLTSYLAAAQEILDRRDRPAALTTHFLEATEDLRTHLATPQGLSATWSDLKQCVVDDSFFDAIAVAAQLETQLGLAHRDGSGVLDEILRILRRNAWSIGYVRQRQIGRAHV